MRGSRVTVAGQQYVILRREPCAPPFTSLGFEWTLRRLSDRTLWQANGRRVQHNTILSSVAEGDRD
jgi:hypothetical protein